MLISFCRGQNLKVKGNTGQHHFLFYVSACGSCMTSPVHWPRHYFSFYTWPSHRVKLAAGYSLRVFGVLGP